MTARLPYRTGSAVSRLRSARRAAASPAATRSLLAALSGAAAVPLAAVCCAALCLGACSSSDDVVASLDEASTLELPSANAAGTPWPTIVQSVSESAPAPGVPAALGTALPPPPIAGSASAGIGRPAPPGAPLPGEALFVSGTPQIPPLAGAERWPLPSPLRQFFPPAPEHRPVLVVVQGPVREALRELAIGHGLGVAAPTVGLLVEDDVGDQYRLLLSDDPPPPGAPLPADE